MCSPSYWAMSTCSKTRKVNKRRLIIIEPTSNSHATPIETNLIQKQFLALKEGKILEYHPIKPHVPLLMLRRAKSIPFLCCQNTPEAECFP